jgi:hypothetical protein
MATSGSFDTSDAGNMGGSPDRMHFEWGLASQNQGGNYSTINWNIRGWGGLNGYWTQNYQAIVDIHGQRVQTTGSFQMYQNSIFGSGSLNIGHDGAGNASFGASASGRIYYNTVNSSGSGSWSLPRIPKAPSVGSNNVSNVNTTSVVMGGNVSDEGGSGVSSRGVVYSSATSNPTTGNSRVNMGGGGGGFSGTISGLAPNTTYYMRAFAQNGVGTSYGAVRTVTTYELPTITTDSISNIAGTSVTANGTLTNNGNPDIVEKGFVYATTPNPTTANLKVSVSGVTTGAFSGNLTGLTPSSVYYIRAFARNSAGTVYGSELSFQTVVLSTLTTEAPANVTTTTVDMSGEVTSDGGGTVSERGFVYGTTANPTTANSKLVVGSGLGEFAGQITGLTPSATYYVRSYGINEGGTGYGNEVSFTAEQTAPLQPSNLSPANGIATDDLTPTLAWQYNAGSANDDQSAYQIIVVRQSDSAPMWDSGKVVSTDKSVAYGGTALVYNEVYQWQVRTYNQADLASPYSGAVTFKTSQLPVATITYPTDTATIASNTPTVTWTYSDAESTPQVKYRLVVLAENGVTVLHDTGEVLGTATSYQIPDAILDNLSTYYVTIELWDGDGLSSGVISHQFSIEFLAPAQPSISTTVAGSGVVDVNVTINRPPLEGWFADRVSIFKKTVGGLEWKEIIDDYNLEVFVLDDGENLASFTQTNEATAPVAGAAKYGEQSLGLGASGAGNAFYVKNIDIPNVENYDALQAWINVVDNTKFTSIDIRIEVDSTNYYEASIPSGNLVNGTWTPLHVDSDNWTVVGTPQPDKLTRLNVVVSNTNGAITAGNILVDQIRLLKTNYTFKDYETANGENLMYGVTAFAVEPEISTGMVVSTDTLIAFTESRFNTYLVPPGDEQLMVGAWHDGSNGVQIEDKTETQYYEPKGAKKPIVLVNANQQYKTGSMELWFFDEKFDGNGITGVEVLESIKNRKPLLLRTWWGRNYWVSIDGQLVTGRKPGVYWSVSFAFTEIQHNE